MAKDVKNIRVGHNGFDPETTEGFITRIENLAVDKETEKSKYMTACKVIKEDQDVVYQEAKDKGFTIKSMKALVKSRSLTKKAEKCRDDLEPDGQDDYDLIAQALGMLSDTPLGAAALSVV